MSGKKLQAASYNINKQVLKNKYVLKKIKLRVYKTIIRSHITYASDTTTQNDQRALQIQERKIM